jgi:hypothetical protein
MKKNTSKPTTDAGRWADSHIVVIGRSKASNEASKAALIKKIEEDVAPTLMQRIAAGLKAHAAEVAAGVKIDEALGREIKATRAGLSALDAMRVALYDIDDQPARLELERVENGRTQGLVYLEYLEAKAIKVARAARAEARA